MNLDHRKRCSDFEGGFVILLRAVFLVSFLKSCLSVGFRRAAPATPGSLFERQTLRSGLELLNQNCHSNEFCRIYIYGYIYGYIYIYPYVYIGIYVYVYTYMY